MRAIGIDIGTTSICLGVYEEETGRLSAVRQEKNHFLEGTFRQDPDRIYAVVKEMLDNILQSDDSTDRPSAIGISSQMHGILYVDRAGRAVSPYYTWKEESGNGTFGEETYASYLSRVTGCEMYTGYGSVTHFTLQQTGQIPAQAVCLANIGDYIAMRLCDAKEPVMSPSIAVSLGGFGLQERRFAMEALERAGVATSYYPQVRAAGFVLGTYEGIPVTCAQGDNQASFYAAIGEKQDALSVNVGTGSQVSLFHRELIEGTEAEIRPFTEKGFLYVQASVNGGKVYERLAEFVKGTVFAVTGIETDVYEKLEEAGAQVPATDLRITPLLYGSRQRPASDESAKRPAAENLTLGRNAGRPAPENLALGRNTGRQAPKNPAPGGSMTGLTAGNFTLGHMVRAYVAGMALELYRMYEQLPEVLKQGKREIIASGNGIRKNRLLRQEVERLFGLPVRFRDIEEEAAAGAAMWALAEVKRHEEEERQ